MTKNQLIATLQELGIKPNKGLGQNFLIDKNILAKIVATAEIEAGDRVLEIGPGLGVLTQALITAGASVTFIEKDSKLFNYLSTLLSPVNGGGMSRGIAGQREGDAAKTDFNDLMGPKPWKFVSNLPYSITSIALRKALYCDNPPQLLVALIQKEVAERILAKDKKAEVSLLSLMSYLACSDIKIIHKVSSTCFYPPPKVESAIIKMIPMPPQERIKKWGIDPEAVMKIAKQGFAHPRKLLGRNLNLPASQWQSLAEKLNINPKARAEDLSVNDWANLGKYFNAEY
ncbi:MAG: 16S rRNA (adenine(1518)-N(6)/adenine(1519)-N(6))-dimethyltransferase RsmA [Patescibacteria group bacterium]